MLNHVNTTDILSAIRLGCETMSRVFDERHNYSPYFGAYLRPTAFLKFSNIYSDAHVPGRHLNALLTAEDAVGVVIQESVIEKHSSAAFRSFSGSLALPLNRDTPGDSPIRFTPHNIREGLHGLYALARYRNSFKARELVESCIKVINDFWNPDSGWNYDNLENQHGLNCISKPGFIGGLARAIGPLTKYFIFTGYAPALELAVVLKDVALNGYFTEEGNYDVSRLGTHIHSITCTMSSLAQLADLTKDNLLMSRVKVFYDNGLKELRDEIGWSLEVNRVERNSDVGEGNNSGDILETALLLGNSGYTSYFQDAERILRCHLLPSQLRDISFVPDCLDGCATGCSHHVAGRLKGAFGFPAPYGHEPVGSVDLKFNLDIVGGVVGSLCEAYRSITNYDGNSHRINLLFDINNQYISIDSQYTHPELRLLLKHPGLLNLRLPLWLNPETINVSGYEGSLINYEGYLHLSNLPVGELISVKFDMPTEEIMLEHRMRNIRTRIKGDQVASMENFGTDLTFFRPLE